MKLYIHFCAFGFSNCYVLGDKNEAVIIDPGSMDKAVLSSIEDNEYKLAGVLITHNHPNHVHGLTTLKRIYNTDIYSLSPVIQEYKSILVRNGETIQLGSFNIETFSVPGHSVDSAVFKIDRMLFTGDALTAGLIGKTSSIYGTVNQMTALRSRILSLPGDYSVFPGHGPPTNLDAERRFNAGINDYETYQIRRIRFRPEFD